MTSTLYKKSRGGERAREGQKGRKGRRKRKSRWGQLAASSRRELRFCHRCPRGFSSCKVIVKGLLSLFSPFSLYPFAASLSFPVSHSASFLPTVLPFAHTFSLTQIPFRAHTHTHTPLPLFLHFLPANHSSRLFLCSSATLVFIFPPRVLFLVRLGCSPAFPSLYLRTRSVSGQREQQSLPWLWEKNFWRVRRAIGMHTVHITLEE